MNIPLVFLLACLEMLSTNALTYDYLGCYKDSKVKDLDGAQIVSNEVSAESCLKFCYVRNYKYFGLQAGQMCVCGTAYGLYGKADSANSCNSACLTDNTKMCGGIRYNSVYEIKSNELRDSFVLDKANETVRQSLKCLSEGDNVFIYNSNDFEWIRNENEMPVKLYKKLEMEQSDNETGVLVVDKTAKVNKYRELTGRFDLVGNATDELEVDETLATIWDIVWVRGDKLEHYFFRISNCVWVEKIDNEIINKFFFHSAEGKRIVLHSDDRNFYMVLKENMVQWGNDLNEMTNLLYVGYWANLHGKRLRHYTQNMYECDN